MTGRDAPWPLLDLDVAQIRAAGREPQSFRQFILKIHSRCNLSCSYCYIYEMSDQGWRQQPVNMSWSTVSTIAYCIAEHVRTHDLYGVEIILHGGEPLLAGVARITELVELFRAEIPDNEMSFSVQTNGTLLDRSMLEMLKELGIRVGISLDGDAEATGRHRHNARGASSFDDVASGLELINSPEFREIYSGILCTIDVRNDPVATYEALLKFTPPTIDFLLPHANWAHPPPGAGYADWLIAVFDRWYSAPEQETSVRMFREMIQLILGGRGSADGLGLQPSTLIVVDTDGSIKQLDSLNSAYPLAASTGLDVFNNSFDDALEHPTTVARQIGEDALSDQCRACPVMQICGGGLYPHRYRSGIGFRNPSVYCADLLRLIFHVRARVTKDVNDLNTAQPRPLGGCPERRPGPRGVLPSMSARTGRARRRAVAPPLRGSPQPPRPWTGWPLPSRYTDDRRPMRSGNWSRFPGPSRWPRPGCRRTLGLPHS
jgi:uncharacterized protein